MTHVDRDETLGAGPEAEVNVDKGDTAIANVTTADVMASNGVIHVIDKVLMP